jgi:hypothetical protein
MRPEENATEADNTQAPDPKLVDEEIHPLDPPQEAVTAVPECERIYEEVEQNQGESEGWHTFKTP